MDFEKADQPCLMVLQRLTPQGLETSFVHQPPQSFPYLASITRLQRWVVSLPYLHNHFPNKAWLKVLKFLIPKPPYCNGEQTWAQFTSRNLGDSSNPPHRNFL